MKIFQNLILLPITLNMLLTVTFEHFIANIAMKRFNIFMVARNVLFQSIATVKCFTTDVADVVSFLEMTLITNFLI